MTIKPNQTNLEQSICSKCENGKYPHSLLSLPQVLAQIPISRSAWLSGVRRGIYPPPVRLSTRRIAWKSVDIDALINRFTSLYPILQHTENKVDGNFSSNLSQST
jgi:predicted DNA-binding transcriptional regulator AlpA